MNKLFVLMGPSGAGKSTLANSLMANRSDFGFLRKVTTRPRRPDDQDQDFVFVSKEDFDKTSKTYTYKYQLRNNYYGITKSSLEKLQGNYLVSIIGDFDTLQEMKANLNVIAIYVRSKPEIIAERLNLRVDQPEEILKSKKAVGEHLSTYAKRSDLFDYVIDNNSTLEDAEKEFMHIVEREVN